MHTPVPASQTPPAPAREILNVASVSEPVAAPAPASEPAPAAASADFAPGERPAPHPSGPAAKARFRMPRALAARLSAGGATARAGLKAHGPMLGVVALVFAAGLTLGVAAGARLAPEANPNLDAARGVQAMLQWKGAMAIGPAASPQLDTSKLASDLRALRAGMDDLRGLDKRVAGLAQAVEKARAEGAQNLAQLNGQVEKARADTANAVGQVATVVRAMDQAGRDTASRIAQIGERVERIEKGGPLTTAAISAPAQASGQPAATPAATPAEGATGKVLAGWGVHVVRGSLAVIEGPDGVFEVARGQTVPMLGKIESFERKGRGWQVVTSRGVIEPVVR